MDPLTASALVAAGGSALGGLMEGFSAGDINKRNLEFQRENLSWQRMVQEKTWEREDTAAQRRAADFAKAGINPLLAAGSTANSGAVVQTHAPQLDMREAGYAGKAVRAASDLPAQVLQMQSQAASIDNIKADAELKRAQAAAVNVKTPMELKAMGSTIDLQSANIKEIGQRIESMNPQTVNESVARVNNLVDRLKMDRNIAQANLNINTIMNAANTAVAEADVNVKVQTLAKGVVALEQMKLDLLQNKMMLPAKVSQQYITAIDGVLSLVRKSGK